MKNYMKQDHLSCKNSGLYKPEFFSGFLFATAKVASITAMIFFHIIIFNNVLFIYFQILTKDVISAQVKLEHSRIAERERLFLVYAKQWWREFLQIRASHSNRLVKIFAQDECGTNRPVCSFVSPLRAGRLLDSPRQVARFVSLLGYEHSPSVGGGKVEMWSSLHAFLCKGKGVSKILKNEDT